VLHPKEGFLQLSRPLTEIDPDVRLLAAPPLCSACTCPARAPVRRPEPHGASNTPHTACRVPRRPQPLALVCSRQAVCNDGTPSYYYLRRGYGSLWLVYLEGGFWCWVIPRSCAGCPHWLPGRGARGARRRGALAGARRGLQC
jgi:hypothetical protein